jgi:hypothetical protein
MAPGLLQKSSHLALGTSVLCSASPCVGDLQRMSPLSQGGSAGSNPVGATREAAGQGPDRRHGGQALDHL